MDQYVASVRQGLATFHAELLRFAEDHGSMPAANSQAATERLTYADPEQIFSLWGVTTQLLEFGGEHLSAFNKHMTEPVELIACWTCIRSMMESCSLAAWFLDPSVDAGERVGRLYAHRFEGMVQELRLMTAIGQPQTELDKCTSNMTRLAQDALTLGYPTLTNKKKAPIGIRRPMPGPTEIVELALGEGNSYRLLSALAHSHHWAIRQLCYVEAHEFTEPDGISGTAFRKGITLTRLAYMATRIVSTIARPFWHQCQYFGFDVLRMEEILENVADAVVIKEVPKIRFWRS